MLLSRELRRLFNALVILLPTSLAVVAEPTRAQRAPSTVPAGDTFFVSDPKGKRILCGKVGGSRFFVVKRGSVFLPGSVLISDLKKQLKRAPKKDQKKLKAALKRRQAEIVEKDRLCAGSDSVPPGPPSPVPLGLERLARPITVDDVVTLVDKAGFGLGPDEDRLVAIGVDQGIDALVDAFMTQRDEESDLLPRVMDQLDGQLGNTTTQTPTGQRRAILDLWIHTKNPYAERLAMSLLGIWTVGGEVIEDETFRYANWEYYDRLRKVAYQSTTIPSLAVQIARDPLMLMYLNGDSNTVEAPNENFARELMELFTLGPLDLDGNPNYTETNRDGSGDIPTAAKILTGWRVKKDYSVNRLVAQFDPNKHTPGLHVMFAGTPWQFSASTDEELILGIFAKHPQVKNYYAKELLKIYLTPDPPRALVEAFGTEIARNNFDLRPAMRTLFASAAFYDPSFRRTVPADPYTTAARIARILRMQRSVNVGEIERRAADMGFMPNLPPSVFWYPQSAWNSSSALLEKTNLLALILADSTAQKGGSWSPDKVLPVGPVAISSLIEFVRDRCKVESLTQTQVQAIQGYLTTQRQYDGSYTPFQYDNTNADHRKSKGLGVYVLIMMSSNFQLL